MHGKYYNYINNAFFFPLSFPLLNNDHREEFKKTLVKRKKTVVDV